MRLLLEDIMDVLRVLSGDNARSKIDRARDAWAIVGTHPLSGRAEVAANRQSNHRKLIENHPRVRPIPSLRGALQRGLRLLWEQYDALKVYFAWILAAGDRRLSGDDVDSEAEQERNCDIHGVRKASR